MWGMINAVVTSVAFIWGAPWRQGEALRVFRSIQRVAIGIGLGMVLLFYAYPDALMSRLADLPGNAFAWQSDKRTHASRLDVSHRANFLGAFNYDRWPYGYGIGTTALRRSVCRALF